MIIDYRNIDEPMGKISPLHIILQENYSLSGNIVVEQFETQTQIRFNLPNVTNEAGILFSMLFMEKISRIFNVLRNINTDIDNNKIRHKFLKKTSEESVIVIPEIKTLAESSRLNGWVNNESQYEDIIHCFEELSISEIELIIQTFNTIVKTFRLVSLHI